MDTITQVTAYLLETLFKGNQTGFFIEMLAGDGISYSVSHTLESASNWKGINIEYRKDHYKSLIRNRPHSTNLYLPEYSTTVEFTVKYAKMVEQLKVCQVDLLCLHSRDIKLKINDLDQANKKPLVICSEKRVDLGETFHHLYKLVHTIDLFNIYLKKN